MFKFRRSSLCRNTDVISPTSSSEDESNEEMLVKNVLKNDSESRLVRDSTDEKESLSDSSSESITNSTSHSTTTTTTENLFPTCKVNNKTVSVIEENTTLVLGEKEIIVEPSPSPIVEQPSSAVAMLDRKRKERHNSLEQETKVIRGNDPELNSEIIDLGEGRNPEMFVQPNSNGNSSKEIVPDTFTPIATNQSGGNGNSMSFMENDSTVDSHIDGDIVSSKALQFGYGREVKTMPINFEVEKQRQWERTAAQWNSRKIRKSYHRPRHGKSSKSFSEVESIIHANHSDDHQFENLTISPVEGPVSKYLPVPRMSLPVSLSNDAPDDEKHDGNDLAPDMDNLAPRLHPSLDFSTLHHHVDSHEPMTCRAAHFPSSEQVMLSPRNSIMRNDSMDPSIPPSPPLHQIPLDPPISRQILDGNQDSKINALSRQIANLKKQLKMLEEEYELLMGYKPSHADKLNNKEMKKHLLVLSKLKKELKQIREDPSSLQNPGGNGNTVWLGVHKIVNSTSGTTGIVKEKSLQNLEVTVKNVEKVLHEGRKIANRPEDLMLMTNTELLREKSSMQKELIIFERRFGRPDSKEEKEIVRSLYERYRTVKKLSGRISFSTVKENSLDLAPILEHETLDLQNETDIPKISVVELKKEVSTSPRSGRRRFGLPSTDKEMDNNLRNEDYNEMDTNELELKYRNATEEKRKLRMSLRKFEAEFQNQTGRLPQKEDKHGSGEMELVYQKYKHIRGIVRLLDVLIKKRKFPHMQVDLTKLEVED